jgi:tetratricopeptide (TPR) repeat protein
LLLSGRLDEAEERIVEHAAFAERHGFDSSEASQMYRLNYERGTLAELEPVLEMLVEEQPAISAWRVALIGMLTTSDRFDEASVHLEALAADDFAMVHRDGLWTVTIAGAARTAGTVGALNIAEAALDYMTDRTGLLAYAFATYEQPVAMSVGTAAMALGRFDEADRLFAEALDLSERAQAPTYVAMTQSQWAESHLLADREGDADKARSLALQAHETAEALGLGRVEVLSRRTLDQIGG